MARPRGEDEFRCDLIGAKVLVSSISVTFAPFKMKDRLPPPLANAISQEPSYPAGNSAKMNANRPHGNQRARSNLTEGDPAHMLKDLRDTSAEL